MGPQLGMCASSVQMLKGPTIRGLLTGTQVELLVKARRRRYSHLGRRTSHRERHRASPNSQQILGLGDRNAAYPSARKLLHVSAGQVPQHG